MYLTKNRDYNKKFNFHLLLATLINDTEKWNEKLDMHIDINALTKAKDFFTLLSQHFIEQINKDR